MKKKELQETRNKPKEDLIKAIEEKRGQIVPLRLEFKMGKHGNLRIVKNARRELAQLKTLLREKERKDE